MPDRVCNRCASTTHFGFDHPGVQLRRWAHPQQMGVNLNVVAFGRWYRLCVTFGQQTSSITGLWHTNLGSVHGWNLRLGRRYVGRCVTFIAHTRKVRPLASAEVAHA